jgi:hypothetical protein
MLTDFEPVLFGHTTLLRRIGQHCSIDLTVLMPRAEQETVP